MPEKKMKPLSGQIDSFRIAASLLIIAIHTGPFSSVNETADFLFTYCFARIGVPFFLMTTGYFVLAPCFRNGFCHTVGLRKFLIKTTAVYLAATLLYLPVNLYAGHLSLHPGIWLKDIIFDGTFYHLWYLPAAILGCLLLVCLLKKLPFFAVTVTVLLLYAIGLLGDSYYHVLDGLPAATAFYDILFGISSYTRNGIFYAPVFLLLGLFLRQYKKKFSLSLLAFCFFLSMVGMLAEGYITFVSDLQRHNSMYLFLLPCMFFLFQLLLKIPGKSSKTLRNASLLIYILHPICIIGVRGIAKVTGLSKLLVENSPVHYIMVCLLTVLTAGIIVAIHKKGVCNVSKRPRLD